ncbi:MAG TPA: GNAT family N-acetyltransferase [Frankiaceae bacterium]|nr:GNAT family N-acetyltransferase [Frankiaceae bacterium]
MSVRAVPEADWEQAAALAQEAFGSFEDTSRWSASLAHSHAVGAYDGGRLVSFARVKPYEQWFGGRAVPMGGIASVAVAATHQRRGLARETVAATLPVLREQGLAVSALFPATTPLYRGLGWEHAGDYTWLDVPGALLRALGPVEGVTLRPATEADLPGVFAAYDAVCRDTNGLLARRGPFFDLRPETVLGVASFLVADGESGIEGWTRADRRHAGHHVDVEAWDVVATTRAAARALWFALGAGASTVKTVRAKAYADDLLPHLAEPEVTVHEHLRWMLRLADAPAAVAARGWPAGLRTAVDLDVTDEQVPDGAGHWRLTVEDGNGTLTRGGDGTVALGIGALSALYSGYADPRTLRRAGLLSCADDDALDTLAAMTAGPRPRLLDYF